MADRAIVVDRSPGECRVAVLEDGRLAELSVERAVRPWRLQSIVLARVTASKGVSGGVFVDLGGEAGFLECRTAKRPVEGEAVPVEVIAEACGAKATLVTSALSLQGRFLTFASDRPGLAVSRRIRAGGERTRLRNAVAGRLPDGVGCIVHATARDCDELALQDEAGRLAACWRDLNRRSASATAPALLRPAPGPLQTALRDYPDAALHEGRDGSLFREHQIDAAVDEALERRAGIAGGGSLAFDETEALTAIDVDIADAADSHGGAERFAAAVAREVLWQIRLRRLAGLLVVDFPRFRKAAVRDRLEQDLKAGLEGMRDPPTVHGWTRTGLLEITRARRGPTLAGLMLSRTDGRLPGPETVALEALRRVIRDSRGLARPVLVCPRPVRQLLLGPLRASLDETARRLGGPIAIEDGDAVDIKDRQTE